jgi:hypothetical protein
MSHFDQLEAPKHLTSLATSAQLVSVEVSVWTGSVRDKATGSEVASSKMADDDTVEVTKKLLAGSREHKALIINRQTIYNWMNATTFDWAGSFRLLPTARHGKFMKEYAEHERQTLALQEEFLRVYPDIVSNTAFSKQGKLFRREDYPDVATLRHKFGIRLHKMPVPMDDFRCAISAEAIEDDRAHYRKQTEQYVERIASQMADNFVSVMESIHYCCDIETYTDKKGDTKTRRRRLYDTTIQKALEMCETFKEFNITNDVRLEAARAALEATLLKTNLEALRESDTARINVKNDVEDILSRFKKPASDE